MSTQSLDSKSILQRAFPGIPAKEAQEMAAIGKVETYDSDVVLCLEGAREDTFYILLDGDVRVIKAIERDQTRLLKHLLPGDFFSGGGCYFWSDSDTGTEIHPSLFPTGNNSA